MLSKNPAMHHLGWFWYISDNQIHCIRRPRTTVPCIFQTLRNSLRVFSNRGMEQAEIGRVDSGSSAASYDHLCQASWRSSASWKGAWFNKYAVLHPWKPTWKLKDTQLKRNIILNTSIFGLHVKFPGCIRFILFMQCIFSFRLCFCGASERNSWS